jgi:RNA polymerase sigma-70 factor (ECF subfamily)
MVMLVLSEDGIATLKEIYDRYKMRMLYTMTQILGQSLGEDALHDVFVKLIERFENNTELLRGKPVQYFVTIARNHSLNMLKKNRIEAVPLDEEFIDSDIFLSTTVSPEAALLDNEADERLVSLIRRLKPIPRQIFEYKYIEGYTNAEIADIMNITQTYVSTCINTGKKRLKEMLEGEAQ